jgi:hypothetical protein
MNEFKFVVELEVTVDAFDESDARELLDDAFGLGEDCGVTIESAKFHVA